MSDETPKLRLKPKLAADASIAATVAAAPAAAPVSTIAPPPPLAPPPPPPPSFAPPPPMPFAPVANVVPPPSIPAPIAVARSPRSSKNIQRAALGIGLAGIFIFTSAGYVAYRNLSDSDEETEEQTDARDDKSIAQITAASTAPTPATAAEPTPQPSPDSTLMPRAENEEPAVSGVDASARQWVNTVKISGTRSGRSPKVLIGGKTYSVGETVHAELGITFDDYDAGRHLVRFKDRSGARYERRVR